MNEAFDARQATEMPLIRINTAHRAASRIGGPREQQMIGNTLITDQIRNAPAEVQRWSEHEVIAPLGIARIRGGRVSGASR